jgi:ubiquinone/menaquinone biosynthesis C-methylase UbiE
MKIEYTGIDIVQSLLDYAKSKSPREYKFLLHRALNVPAPDEQVDFVCAFSVFTHLLHAESYIYMEDIWRVLKPRGKLVFSFLEFNSDIHWDIFKSTVESQRHHSNGHLNTFIEFSVVAIWSRRLGYELEAYIPCMGAPWNGKPLGQSVAILRKL